MNALHQSIAAAFAFGVGATIGSFLNVCIWRIPRGESVSHPPSRCPSCKSGIACADNVPILSWLALRGRCRSCSWPIPSRYPLVEGSVALLFAIAMAVEMTEDPFDVSPLGTLFRLLYQGLLAAVLVTSAMIEWDTRLQAGPRRNGSLLDKMGGIVAAGAANLLLIAALLLARDYVGAGLSLGLLAVLLVRAERTHRAILIR